MPQTIKLDDGTEQVVYTEQETQDLAAQKAKEIEDAKEAEKAELESQLKAKDEELLKLKDKDVNFGELRKQKEKAEKDKEELSKNLADLSTEIAEIRQQPIKTAIQTFLDTKVGASEEDKKVFNTYFEKMGKDAKTVEEVQEALNLAYDVFSSKKPKPNPDSNFLGTGVDPTINTGAETEESKEIGSALGVTPKDKETFKGKKTVPII